MNPMKMKGQRINTCVMQLQAVLRWKFITLIAYSGEQERWKINHVNISFKKLGN